MCPSEESDGVLLWLENVTNIRSHTAIHGQEGVAASGGNVLYDEPSRYAHAYADELRYKSLDPFRRGNDINSHADAARPPPQLRHDCHTRRVHKERNLSYGVHARGTLTRRIDPLLHPFALSFLIIMVITRA
jgi:hypothetical protein